MKAKVIPVIIGVTGTIEIGDDTENYTNGLNGDKMDTNVIGYQKRDQKTTVLALVN